MPSQQAEAFQPVAKLSRRAAITLLARCLYAVHVCDIGANRLSGVGTAARLWPGRGGGGGHA